MCVYEPVFMHDIGWRSSAGDAVTETPSLLMPTSKPLRVCVISDIDPLTQALGSTEYLSGVMSLVAGAGHECHLLVLSPLGQAAIRRPVGLMHHYSRPYRSVTLRRALRYGDKLYNLDPTHWLRRLLRRIGLNHKDSKEQWLRTVDPGAADWAARRIATLDPDVVIANYFNAGEVLRLVGTRPVKVIIAHDILSDRKRSFLVNGVEPDFTIDEERERSGFQAADLCITIKASDAEKIHEIAPAVQTLTIPPLIKPLPAIKAPPNLEPRALFVGGNFKANQDALRWFIESVWPQVIQEVPSARLRIVGRIAASVPNVSESVVRVGFVDNLQFEYDQAAVSVAPMRVGSGVNVKVVEALGAGVPVVTTACGADGLPPWPGQVLTLADAPTQFADAVIRLLGAGREIGLREKVRRYAEENFDPGAHGETLNARLHELLKGRPS